MKKLTTLAIVVLLFFVTEAACQRTPATAYTRQYGIGTYGPSGEQPVNYIGSVDPGDSLVYNHPNGRYIDTFRYACGDAGGYMVINGRRINTPNTGGALKWVNVVDTVNVTDGRLVIKFQARRVNLLWLSVGPSPLPPAPTAYAGRDTTIEYPARFYQLQPQFTGDGVTWAWAVTTGMPITGGILDLYSYSVNIRLTVTDRYGRVATDDVVVRLNFDPAKEYVSVPMPNGLRLVQNNAGVYGFQFTVRE